MSDQHHLSGSVYIAGPMTGLPNFNFPAFDQAKDILLRLGFTTVSPADLTRVNFGDPTDQVPADQRYVPHQTDYAVQMRYDLKALMGCHYILLLDGWQNSKGARLEALVAHALGIQALIFVPANRDDIPLVPKPLQQEDLDVFYRKAMGFPSATVKLDASTFLAKADQIVSVDRQAAYGHPADNFEAVALMISALVGVDVSPHTVPLILIGLKLVRENHRHQVDNLVDVAGYAKTLMLAHERWAEP